MGGQAAIYNSRGGERQQCGVQLPGNHPWVKLQYKYPNLCFNQLLLPKASRAMSILLQKEEEQRVMSKKRCRACPVKCRLGEDPGTCWVLHLVSLPADTTELIWESVRKFPAKGSIKLGQTWFRLEGG